MEKEPSLVGAVGLVIAGPLLWVAEGIYGDAVLAAIKPMIPATFQPENVGHLAQLVPWFVPLIPVAIGLWLLVRIWRAREAHLRHLKAQPAAPAPVVSGTGHVVTVGQTGGIAAQKVMLAPELNRPTYEIVYTGRKKEGEYFVQRADLNVKSLYAVDELLCFAVGKELAEFDVDPYRVGVFTFGPRGKRDGFSFVTLYNAIGRYEMIVKTRIEQRIEFIVRRPTPEERGEPPLRQG